MGSVTPDTLALLTQQINSTYLKSAGGREPIPRTPQRTHHGIIGGLIDQPDDFFSTLLPGNLTSHPG